MKQYNLLATKREKSTKGDKNMQMNEGFVPGVLYGKDLNLNIYCFVNDLHGLIYTADVYVVNLTIEDKTYKAVIKDIQYHPMSDAPIHIDFMEVADDKVIKLKFPISFSGSPIGATKGGKIFRKMRRIRLKGKVSDMPEVLDFDISHLDIGEMLKIRDIKIPNIEILEAETTPLVSVNRPRVAVLTEESEDDEEGTEEGEDGAAKEEQAAE
jgi:large subunit ribosomal protein L25